MIRSLSTRSQRFIPCCNRVTPLSCVLPLATTTIVGRRTLMVSCVPRNNNATMGLSYTNDANDTVVDPPSSSVSFREVPPPVDRGVPVYKLSSSYRTIAAATAVRDANDMKDVGGAAFLDRFDRLIRHTAGMDAVLPRDDNGDGDHGDVSEHAAANIRRRVAKLATRVPSSPATMELRGQLQQLADQKKYDELMALFQYSSHHTSSCPLRIVSLILMLMMMMGIGNRVMMVMILVTIYIFVVHRAYYHHSDARNID